MTIKLRFSRPVTLLIAGILGLVEVGLNQFPDTIPVPFLRFIVVGALPLLVMFLYQEAGTAPAANP